MPTTVTKPPILDETGQDILTQLRRIADAKEANLMGYGGAVLFADLPNPTTANLNLFYLIKDAFTTDARFVVGAGVSESAGKYWCVINIGTEAAPVCKYDELGTLVDLSTKQDKALASAVTVDGVQYNQVETTLSALATLSNDNKTTLATKADLLDLAPAFDSSNTYAKGDYVTYTDGEVYRFTANTHTGAWASGDVVRVAIGNEIKALNSGKVDVNQGSANEGKILIVDSSGNLVLDSAPTEEIIGSGAFLSGAASCAVSISLENGVYALNYYTTNSDATVKDELTTYSNNALSVTFRKKPTANGTMYIVARKVG